MERPDLRDIRARLNDKVSSYEAQHDIVTLFEYIDSLERDLLECARQAGEDVSDLDHPGQLTYPAIGSFAIEAVKDLMRTYEDPDYIPKDQVITNG